MKRILVGICSSRHDDRFWDSFFNFMKECSNYYDISSIIIKNKFLPDAQNEIMQCALNCKYDYLLLLDDDQWGHSKEMLECLINANTFVATMKTYQRQFPYACAIFKNLENNVVVPIENGQGYVKCDLTGFPMTLINLEVIKYLEQPYFRPYSVNGRDWNSDVDFFNRLSEKGIKPIGCFQHVLNHDNVTEDNVKKLRYDDRFTGNNIASWKLLNDLESGNFKINNLSLSN